MADDPTRCCTKCERDLPLSAFAKDARRKSGVRAACKRCDAQATSDRRRADRPAPGKLVLVNFPAPPSEQPQAPAASAPRSGGAGTYVTAAEALIDALDPPAGPADALLVRSLRGLAELLDVAEHGSSEWVVRDTTALVAKLIAVQRELAATRAAKGQAAAPAKPASRLASGQF